MSDLPQTGTDIPSTSAVFIKEEPIVEDEPHLTEMMAHACVKVELQLEDPMDVSENMHNVKRPIFRGKQIGDFTCDECEFRTLYRHSLGIHKKTHRPEKPYKCETCGYVTKYQTSLRRHITHQHLYPKEKKDIVKLNKTTNKKSNKDPNMPKVFICDQCDYTSKFKANVSIHMKKHTSEKPHECPDCDYKSAYSHHLLKHRRVHLKDPSVVYSCNECRFVSKFEGRLERHMIKIHHKIMQFPYKCPFCDYSAKWKWKLTIHMKRKNRENKMECSVCDFSTYNKCEMAKHEEIHFPDIDISLCNAEIKNMKCKICDFESEDYDVLKLHENDHFINKSNLCASENLPKQYPDIFQVLTKEDDKKYQCELCHYTSKFKASIERHQSRIHTEASNKPFKCEHCLFSTKTKEQLNLHLKRSETKSKMRCNDCDFFCTFKCQLVHHQRTHNAFQCHHCPIRFRCKSRLKRHLEGLKEVNKYKCRYCSFESTKKQTVYCHEMTHSGHKPFKCSFCDFSTVRRQFLLSHIRKHNKAALSEIRNKYESNFKIKEEGSDCNIQIDTDLLDDCAMLEMQSNLPEDSSPESFDEEQPEFNC